MFHFSIKKRLLRHSTAFSNLVIEDDVETKTDFHEDFNQVDSGLRSSEWDVGPGIEVDVEGSSEHHHDKMHYKPDNSNNQVEEIDSLVAGHSTVDAVFIEAH